MLLLTSLQTVDMGSVVWEAVPNSLFLSLLLETVLHEKECPFLLDNLPVATTTFSCVRT